MPEKKSGPGNGLTVLGRQAGKGFHSSEEKEGESLVLKYLLASDGGGGCSAAPKPTGKTGIKLRASGEAGL